MAGFHFKHIDLNPLFSSHFIRTTNDLLYLHLSLSDGWGEAAAQTDLESATDRTKSTAMLSAQRGGTQLNADVGSLTHSMTMLTY